MNVESNGRKLHLAQARNDRLVAVVQFLSDPENFLQDSIQELETTKEYRMTENAKDTIFRKAQPDGEPRVDTHFLGFTPIWSPEPYEQDGYPSRSRLLDPTAPRGWGHEHRSIRAECVKSLKCPCINLHANSWVISPQHRPTVSSWPTPLQVLERRFGPWPDVGRRFSARRGIRQGADLHFWDGGVQRADR